MVPASKESVSEELMLGVDERQNGAGAVKLNDVLAFLGAAAVCKQGGAVHKIAENIVIAWIAEKARFDPVKGEVKHDGAVHGIIEKAVSSFIAEKARLEHQVPKVRFFATTLEAKGRRLKYSNLG